MKLTIFYLQNAILHDSTLQYSKPHKIMNHTYTQTAQIVSRRCINDKVDDIEVIRELDL